MTNFLTSLRIEWDNILGKPTTVSGRYEVVIPKRYLNSSKIKELNKNGVASAKVPTCVWDNAKPYNLANPVIS